MRRENWKNQLERSYNKLSFMRKNGVLMARMWKRIDPIGDVIFEFEETREGFTVEGEDFLTKRLRLEKKSFKTAEEMFEYIVGFWDKVTEVARADELKEVAAFFENMRRKQIAGAVAKVLAKEVSV